MTSFLSDLRFGLRTLAKNPGFAIVAVLTLALGIGASTAIFSVVDAVLLRPLPYPNPQQIVRVWEQAPDGHRMNIGHPNFEDFRAQNHTLSAFAEYESGTVAVSGGSEPVRVNVAEVSRDFFKVMGVQPFRGRTFAPQEQIPHGSPAAIVSYGYWKQYLGGSMDLSRFRLSMVGGVYSVIGVMPAGFDFPPAAAVWFPSELDEGVGERTAHNDRGIGRLRDGVTVAQARADLDGIARRIRAEYGKKVDLTDAAVVPLSDAMVGEVRTALLTLFGAVILLFLIASANVAGLLLARTSARKKELAVRAALGAGRGRLVQQFLAESAMLSTIGGVLGILLALWTVSLLPAILPADLPRQQGINVNSAVLAFTVAVTILVAVALGLIAAWRAGGGALQQALSAGSRSYTGGSQKARSLLVIGEIAATLMLLVGAGLLGRSFLGLVSINPGFREDHLMTMQFSLPASWGFSTSQSEVARQTQLLDQIVDRLRSIPGVQSAGVTGDLPVVSDIADGGFLILNGQKAPMNFDEWGHFVLQNPKAVGHADYFVTSGAYFHAMGIPLIRGRFFDQQDGPDAPNVAVISQALARRQWPGQNPIGQVIDFGNMDGNPKPLTIVGVAGDVRAEGLDQPPTSIIYVDYRQRGMKGNSSPAIVARSSTPGEIVSAARGIFHELAPDMPVKFSTFADELGGWLAEKRFLLLLAGIFAGAALALAAVGIYGIVSYSVTRRTQEIGVRVALGAQRGDVLRMVIGEGARLVAIGLAIGIALSFVATRLISSLLFGVKATDPLTFFVVAVILAAVALLASYIPTRRAMKVDPIVALRYE